ncbi:MAG TPA: hypothetical protein DIT64_03040 [Verrucomicrobiales bacterium]|nr:hypothetical protein [Verrucomicrobiales bacterium]
MASLCSTSVTGPMAQRRSRVREAGRRGMAFFEDDKLLHSHERRLSNNHSRPKAATINTTMMLHDVDELDSSLGTDAADFASVVFFGADG